MNTVLIPTLSSGNAKLFFLRDLNSWRNFAQRITKNPFVKEFLLQRDGHDCAWCKRKLKDTIAVHHVSYEHSCTYNVVKAINTPTLNNPNKTRITPDCENCKKENNQRFMTCMDKLALVHSICNKKIFDTTSSLSITTPVT